MSIYQSASQSAKQHFPFLSRSNLAELLAASAKMTLRFSQMPPQKKPKEEEEKFNWIFFLFSLTWCCVHAWSYCLTLFLLPGQISTHLSRKKLTARHAGRQASRQWLHWRVRIWRVSIEGVSRNTVELLMLLLLLLRINRSIRTHLNYLPPPTCKWMMEKKSDNCYDNWFLFLYVRRICGSVEEQTFFVLGINAKYKIFIKIKNLFVQ